MDDKTQGAWIIHHTRKLQSVTSQDFDQLAVTIIKHTNPSGVGTATTNLEAYKRALATDPVSAFGGIVAVNRAVDKKAAEEIAKLDNGTFKGWARTGQIFKAYATPQAGASAVCRIYIPPGKGDGHFFGRDASECDGTCRKNCSAINRFHDCFLSAQFCASLFLLLPRQNRNQR